jgi:TRAP-type C4-dicarboxylate transport system permease small subunit
MEKTIVQLTHVATVISKAFSIVAALAVGVLMVVNFCDIIGTEFFLASVPGAIDISEELMVVLTLLPIAYIDLERGDIRITMIEDRLPAGIQHGLRIVSNTQSPR